MHSKISYLPELPTVNDLTQFILLEKYRLQLSELWFEYMQKIIYISVSSDEYFKTISDALQDGMGLHELKRGYARDILGIGEKLSVIDIMQRNGRTECVALMSFEDLADIYIDEKKDTFKRAVIDKFFVFLWNKGVLLYPIASKVKNYHRPSEWKILADTTEIFDFISRRYDIKEVSIIKPYQATAILSVLSATTWKRVADVQEDDLFLLESTLKRVQDASQGRVSYAKGILNELRLAMVDIGREDILKPSDILDEMKNYDKKRRYDFIDTNLYPNLKEIKAKAILYHDVLQNEGLAVTTIQGELSAIANFLRYLMEYYPDRVMDINTVDTMFDPSNETNLYSVLSSNQESAKATLNKIIKFLVHLDLYSIKARKNTPKPKNKTSLAPYRQAMPKEMVRHIVDIIKNRPPLLRTKWERGRADISWWKHEVYPVYPLMMLFGYYIPLRGEQVRNLCRERSFVFKDGALDTIIVNTDKNVNRTYLQEIPCVWEDLQIFVPFLEWHKEYYKNIPLVRYHNDINSPWEDIEPLFNTPQTLKPLSQNTHFSYHKKVLCQYQLEVMLQAQERGEKYYPIVAWAKEGKEFFSSIEELNRCSVDRLKDIEIMYDLHSLRVTGATRYLESGVGINLVMQLTGHTTPDTLLRIYINLTQEEKKQKLRSAIKNIYFGEPRKLLQNTSDLIGGELVEAYEKGRDELHSALSDNALFSMSRKLPLDSNSSEYVQGVEIATIHHPSTWLPMVFGICPAVKCPDGRNHKCSLCPYLITGKLFIDGIVLKANQALAKFQRDSLLKEEEEKKGYKNQALAEELELTLEEILGWQEILERINDDLNAVDAENSSSKELTQHKSKKSAFAYSKFETELTYLANAYDAKMIGVEQDRMGLKILTIKAMKLAVMHKEESSFSAIANDEYGAIDYLMEYYQGKRLEYKGFNSFLEQVKTKSA